MEIPLTDAALKQRVKKLDSVHRGSLWAEIHDLGACLAMFGAVDDAKALWDFAQSGKIPLPEERRHPVASAVRYALEQSTDVESLVKEADLQARKTVAEETPALGADWDEPPLSKTPKGMLHLARKLARPGEDGSPSAKELEGLELLRKVLAQPPAPQGATQVLLYDRHTAGLLATDILARHGLRDDAAAMLRSWHDDCVRTPQTDKWYEEPSVAFGQISATRLFCDGILRDKSKLSAKKRAELVAEIIAIASVEPAKAFPQPQDPENALVLRTDFSDDAGWKSVCEAIRAGNDDVPDAAVEFVSDPDFDGQTPKEITKQAMQGYRETFIFVVDRKTLAHPKRPVLVIDLSEKPGRTFRAAPGQIGVIAANLSTQNCGFEDFADDLDSEGILNAGYE